MYLKSRAEHGVDGPCRLNELSSHDKAVVVLHEPVCFDTRLGSDDGGIDLVVLIGWWVDGSTAQYNMNALIGGCWVVIAIVGQIDAPTIERIEIDMGIDSWVD